MLLMTRTVLLTCTYFCGVWRKTRVLMARVAYLNRETGATGRIHFNDS